VGQVAAVFLDDVVQVAAALLSHVKPVDLLFWILQKLAEFGTIGTFAGALCVLPPIARFFGWLGRCGFQLFDAVIDPWS